MAVAVRRQTDNDDKSASLRVVLEELRVRPEAYRLETLQPLLPRGSDETIQHYVMDPVCCDGVLDVTRAGEDISTLIRTAKEQRL